VTPRTKAVTVLHYGGYPGDIIAIPAAQSPARAYVDLPGTDEAAATTLLLPLHQALSDADVREVASKLKAAVERCTRQNTA
jgi:dTDP-4-amino-4,6-dideoxygalactose transaminase